MKKVYIDSCTWKELTLLTNQTTLQTEKLSSDHLNSIIKSKFDKLSSRELFTIYKRYIHFSRIVIQENIK